MKRPKNTMRLFTFGFRVDRAICILGRTSLWGGPDEHPDGPALDAERKAVRNAAEKFARLHKCPGYEVYACSAHGGHTVAVVDFHD